MKKDEKEKSKGASRETEGDRVFNADEPPDMEVALRCIRLLEDLGSREMLEGILETIRSITDKMTDPCASKLIGERLRELTGRQGKNQARLSSDHRPADPDSTSRPLQESRNGKSA